MKKCYKIPPAEGCCGENDRVWFILLPTPQSCSHSGLISPKSCPEFPSHQLCICSFSLPLVLSSHSFFHWIMFWGVFLFFSMDPLCLSNLSVFSSFCSFSVSDFPSQLRYWTCDLSKTSPLTETLRCHVDLSIQCAEVTLLTSLTSRLTTLKCSQETGAGRVLLSVTCWLAEASAGIITAGVQCFGAKKVEEQWEKTSWFMRCCQSNGARRIKPFRFFFFLSKLSVLKVIS